MTTINDHILPAGQTKRSSLMRDWAKLFFRLMPLIDLILVFASFRLAYALRYDLKIIPLGEQAFFAPFDPFLPYIGMYAVWLLFTWSAGRLYSEQRGRSWLEEVYRIVNGVTSATVVVMALSFLLQPPAYSRLMIILAAALAVFMISAERAIYRIVRGMLRRHGVGVERVLILGADEVARSVLSSLITRTDLGYRVVGYLDEATEANSSMGRVPHVGKPADLAAVLRGERVDLVVVTLPWSERERIMQAVSECKAMNVAARVVPDLFQLSMNQVQLETLEGIPLLGLRGESRIARSKALIKRALDLVLIIVCAPLIMLVGLIVATAIKLDSPGSVLFRHRRVGLNGREFYVYKFRTMQVGAEQMQEKLVQETGVDPRRPKWENDPRLTRVGKWVRKTSMDELPNLINVLRGEMSLVGPRPPTPGEVARYEPWMRQRLNTHPGLTCLWQVSGRSKIPFEEQCLMDIYYIDNWSIGLEIQILLRTVPNVLIGNGAY